MTEETERHIDEFRKRLDSILDNFTVADFRRVHAKFFGAILSVEIGFERRFPEEAAAYRLEVYGPEED
jgi:hypothetical protein